MSGVHASSVDTQTQKKLFSEHGIPRGTTQMNPVSHGTVALHASCLSEAGNDNGSFMHATKSKWDETTSRTRAESEKLNEVGLIFLMSNVYTDKMKNRKWLGFDRREMKIGRC